VGDLTDETGDEVIEQTRTPSVATDIKVHDGFVYSTLANDIAVIKMNTPFTTNANISVINRATADYQGQPIQILGWGVMGSGQTSAQLMVASTNVRQNSVCSCYWPSSVFNSDQQICFGGYSTNGVCSVSMHMM
jgi:hypothetical protein